MMSSRLLLASFTAVAAFAVAPSGAAEPPAGARTVRLPMFNDGFVSGWESHQAGLPSTDKLAYKGDRSIEVRLGSGEGHHRSYQLIYGWTGTFTVEPFDRVEFYLHGGETGGQTFTLNTLAIDPSRRPDQGGHFSTHPFVLPDPQGRYIEGGMTRIPANRWVKVTIPVSEMELPNPKWFRGFRLQADSDQRQPPFYIDEMSLVGDVAQTAQVRVDAAQAVRRVSGGIFGICTYSTPGIDEPGQVAAALDADYELQRVFYPTFNMRGWNVNIQKGMLFAEATDAVMMGTVNWSDQPPKQKQEGKRTGEYGTAEEAAAYVAYANVPVDAPREVLEMTLGVDEHGYDWKTVGHWVDLRAKQDKVSPNDGFNDMRIRRAEPFGVKYWELDNEPWLHADRKDWLAYAKWCKEADALMKRVDPTILTGPTIQWNAGDQGKVKYDARRPGEDKVRHGSNEVIAYFLAGHDERTPERYVPDFVVVHNYAGGDSGNADLVTLMVHQQTGGGSWTNQVRGIRDIMTAYWGEEDGMRPFIVCSEWNMRPTFPLSRQYSSIVGALYVANALGEAMQLPENSIEIMTLHDWADGPMDKGGFYENPAIYGWRHETGYGVYRDGGETKYPIHYAFKLLGRYFAEDGDAVLPATTDEPMLQPFAVRQANGNLAVLLINKHPDLAIDAAIELDGFTPTGEVTLHRYGPTQDRAEADVVTDSARVDRGPIRVEPYTMKVVTFADANAQRAAGNPYGMTAVAGSASVELTWDAVGGATAYDVYRGSARDSLQLHKAGVAETRLTDSGLQQGTPYYYAVAVAGGPVPTEPVVATPAAPPTAAPDGLVAMPAEGAVALTWKEVEGADGYTLKRAEAAEGPFEVVTDNPYARVPETERRLRTVHIDRDVQPGRTYHYQVVATTAGGEGPAATARAAPVTLPTGWASTDTTGRRDTGVTIYQPDQQRWILHGEGTGEYDGDDGRFVYQEVEGDFVITAHVLDAEKGQYGKNNFGVHARSALPNNPAFWATMGATPTSGNGFTQGPQWYLVSPESGRKIHRESDDRTGRSGELHVPYFVRLERTGQTLTGYVSKDGQAWKPWHSAKVPNLPRRLYVGIIASSNYPYATAKGVFEAVELEARPPKQAEAN